MKEYKILILLFSTFFVGLTYGSTLSRDVAENMGHLQELIRKPLSERVVDVESHDYNIFMTILEKKTRNTSSVGAIALACLYFAWADDEASRERLEYYAEADILSGLPSFAGGAALYALTMRDLRENSYEETKLLLSYTLGKIENDYQKMFIANRLWVDYQNEALPVILLTAETGKVEFVMQEYLFYLSNAHDTNILRDALALDWHSGAAEIYDWIYVMSAATPGRSTNALEYSPYACIKKMRGKLEELNQP